MRLDPIRGDKAAVGRVRSRPAGRAAPGWFGVALCIGGWVGVGLTSAILDYHDPSSGTTVFWLIIAVSTSLLAIGRGCVIAIRTALSPDAHVFHVRPALRTAAILLGLSAGAASSVIVRAPFDGIAAHGKPLAEVVGELGYVTGALLCLAGSGVALGGARTARHSERNWAP